jgi:pimeloyl-ACP methyl ester carboxylesterase
MTTTPDGQGISGVAAGVPFLAYPPKSDDGSAATVVAWHLLDPPRTEAAMAAAVPLAGLDAWRVYLGLPMTGSRMPAGGPDELMRLGYEDALLNLQGPVSDQAAAEFEPAFADLRERFGLGAGPLGLVGGSIGAAVVELLLAEHNVRADAAVLISPVVRMRSVVEAMERRFDVDYPWSDASHAVADRLDFVTRVDELAKRDAAILMVVGEDDDVTGFREPAVELRDALAERYEDPGRVELAVIPGMGHELAEEPGFEAAPQTEAAAEVDRRAVEWYRRYLGVNS